MQSGLVNKVAATLVNITGAKSIKYVCSNGSTIILKINFLLENVFINLLF
ncbi:hypothetical protein IB642_07520 [Allofrancisella guangzhouensis]|nr:hypothetical protein [Allofrancisella guangzhouensis]MBK2027537.1 hypothetical protein [Allofrancisella guangzhouensis]MBK2044862.1 hypothetical protein [Allofrancisella guangzhouensis]MBK2046075.1 hypothetical protein [Allofrancisella guangzhouensis]